MQSKHYLARDLPSSLQGLATLATDLRWSWNHGADELWQAVDPELWEATANPWLILESISDQRLRVYAGETLLHDFICSTGIASSPTITGTFQILSKEENAYASSWDLWMPYFMGIYRSGPDFTNGIHGLPTLSSGARLWEGYLGRPVSYGCIVVGLDEAAILYEWAELGTMVVIRE